MGCYKLPLLINIIFVLMCTYTYPQLLVDTKLNVVLKNFNWILCIFSIKPCVVPSNDKLTKLKQTKRLQQGNHPSHSPIHS
jgi:hypothetical protein